MLDVACHINKAFDHLFEPYDHRYRFWVERGSAGSGKSYAIAQAVWQSVLADKGRRWLVIRKVRSTVRHSVWALLDYVHQEMGLSGIVHKGITDFTFTTILGSQIICTGLDDPEKLKSIFGITDVWIEEATELTPDDFRQIDLRLRGGQLHKRIILSFNPVSVLSWVKEEFFDRPKDNAHLSHTTYHDNRYLDEAYREELEKLKDIDEYFYTVYALGEWGLLGNRIFSNYVVEDFDYGEDDLEMTTGGMDFGFNHPSAIERAGFKDGELYIYAEVHERGLINSQLIERAVALYGDPRDRELIKADSAEPDRIKEFNEAGFDVIGAKKGKDSVRMGIDYLKRLKIHIHRSNCPGIAREFDSYKWREDKDGNVLDEPVGFNDDGIAALRYAVEEQWAYGQMRVLLPSEKEPKDSEPDRGLQIIRR